MRTAVIAAITGLALLVVAACSGIGDPPDSPPTAQPKPNRPKVISMTGLDPCSVLTDDQITQLGIRFTVKTDNPPSQTTGNVRACTWQSGGFEPDSGVYVQGVTYRSLADVRSDPGVPAFDFVLRGFSAVTRDNSSPRTDSCQVFVDVADGQTFEVAYDHDSGGDPAVACRRAKQAADWGLTYLLSR